MLASDHPYRVRPDGSFEIDHWRMEAVAMRREAMRQQRKAPFAVRFLALAALLMIVGAVVTPQAPGVDGTSVKIAAGLGTAEQLRELPPTF